MTEEPMDITGGATARDIRQNPSGPRPILDPTDPHYGEGKAADEAQAREARSSDREDAPQ